MARSPDRNSDLPEQPPGQGSPPPERLPDTQAVPATPPNAADLRIWRKPAGRRPGSSYRAHEVLNSAWIEERIKVNSVHPQHSEVPFRQLHHYALLFHDEMLEALADGIESRLVTGTMRTTLASLTDSLIEQPYRAER